MKFSLLSSTLQYNYVEEGDVIWLTHQVRENQACTVPCFTKVNFSQSFGKQSGGGTDIVVMGGAVYGLMGGAYG